MKLKTLMAKLLAKHPIRDLIGEFLKVVDWNGLMQSMCNRCVANAYHAKGVKKKREWMHQARIFHRIMDELKMKKAGKTIFKISRRDIYECKCKKRFRVDVAAELNAIFDLDKGAIVVTCPECGKTERTEI